MHFVQVYDFVEIHQQHQQAPLFLMINRYYCTWIINYWSILNEQKKHILGLISYHYRIISIQAYASYDQAWHIQQGITHHGESEQLTKQRPTYLQADP